MNSRKFVILLAIILGIGNLMFNYKSSAETAPGFGTYIDVHMHFYNQISKEWVQQQMKSGKIPRGKGQSIEFQDEDYIACADNMIKLMDKYGIQKVILMPQPRISGQHGSYDYKELLPAIRKYPDRLFLGAGGGILNSMIHGTDPGEVTDEIRKTFRKYAVEMVKDGAKAFAEFAALHLSMNQNHVFEEVSPDHPLFLLLADIAAEYDIPIDFHMEAVVKDTPTPANLIKVSSKNPATLNANIPAFERLLAHNRKAKIVWQHISWDNTGQMTISLLKRMLEDHPNLYLGFKIEERGFKVGTQDPMPNRMVDTNYMIKADWMQFFKDYPDRLLVAADQFVGIPGKTQRPPQYMEQTYSAIKQLPADVLIKVSRDNAIRLYNLK